MKDSVLVLRDLTEINLEEGSSLGNMCVASANRQEMVEAWEQLTTDNLKRVQIMTGGTVSGGYTELVLEHEMSTVKSDGSIVTRFVLREKTEVEMLREEVAELRAGQSIQDGAIADLGAITSEVVEKVEGGAQ